MTVGGGQLARAYVLHTRPWRNTSLLVEALTDTSGRVGLVARGVRRQGNASRACLEPFQPLLMGWRGRGELKTLASVEAQQWRAAPPGRSLLAAYYCSELILRLLGREDPHPGVFDAYERAVAALATAEGTDEATVRRFELTLLDRLGFAPPLAVEPDTGAPVDPELEYDFLPEHGPVRAAGPPNAEAVRVAGAHLLALAGDALDEPAALHSARRVLRASLAPHLGTAPLRSRELYRAMYGSARE